MVICTGSQKLSVKCRDHTIVKLEIERNMPMKYMFDKFSALKGHSNWKFYYDGELMAENKTAEELKMDADIEVSIDAFRMVVGA